METNDTSEHTPDPENSGVDGEPVAQGLPIPKQTPFYRAANRGRYQRQELIAGIQVVTGRKLICYVAESAALTRDDVLPLMDVLHRVPLGSDIDFLLHTTGGDIDAADKIVRILRKRVGDEHQLRVVVPNHAKSAGTLIAIGSDWIVMSESSELGPIDPQIISRDANGQTSQRPAHAYVDGYEALVAIINDPASYEDGKRTDAERLLLSKCDPSMLNLCNQALKRSRQLAEALLHQGMLREEAVSAVFCSFTTATPMWRACQPHGDRRTTSSSALAARRAEQREARGRVPA